MLTTGQQSGSIQSTTMEKRNKTKKQKGEKEKRKERSPFHTFLYWES